MFYHICKPSLMGIFVFVSGFMFYEANMNECFLQTWTESLPLVRVIIVKTHFMFRIHSSPLYWTEHWWRTGWYFTSKHHTIKALKPHLSRKVGAGTLAEQTAQIRKFCCDLSATQCWEKSWSLEGEKIWFSQSRLERFSLSRASGLLSCNKWIHSLECLKIINCNFSLRLDWAVKYLADMKAMKR